MKPHIHAGIEHVVLYGVSAIILIDVLGLIAAKLASRPGMVGKFGTSLGAVVPFHG